MVSSHEFEIEQISEFRTTRLGALKGLDISPNQRGKYQDCAEFYGRLNGGLIKKLKRLKVGHRKKIRGFS